MNDEPLNEWICSLCGQTIEANPKDAGDERTVDHVPPRQFYPKEIRESQQPNLWVVPAHRRCNGGYREDEEYFYHAVYPIVQQSNRQFGQVIHRDLMRRTHNPQTPAMARRFLKSVKTVTDGGIHLPPRVAQYELEERRIKRVAIKIAQGLFYRDEERYVSRENSTCTHPCQSPSEIPESYQPYLQAAESMAVLPEVFSYRHVKFEDGHLFSMLFWEAFVICVAFETP